MKFFVDHLIIFSIALLLDLTLGDPPERVDRYYPIVWISRLMYLFDRRTARGDPRREELLGVVYPLLIVIIFAMPCLLLPLIPSEVLYIALGSLIFKMTFTIKGLKRFGRAVLEATDIDAKRVAVGKIVSRNVADLDHELLDSATIESVAENLTDSVIAPFFYFMLFGIFGAGVFGAMVYRVINTLDALVGYKTREYFYLGWFSAKSDTILNYIPERIAASLIILTSGSRMRSKITGGTGEWEAHVPLTIRAMSHALQVRLEKRGYYVVGEGYKAASENAIRSAIKIVKRSSLLFASSCILFFFLLLLSTPQ